MKVISPHINQSFFFIFSFFIATTTMVSAQDLNATLSGTYAVTTEWGCIVINAGTPVGTNKINTSGEISYYGDGTAEEVGRVGALDPNSNNPFGDMGRYECTWVYEVNDDPNLDCNSNSIIGPIDCDFKYEGSCVVTTPTNPNFPVIDQVWYGKMGITSKADSKDKKSSTSSKGSPDIISIGRHDAIPERDTDQSDDPFKVCGKTGIQIKVSETPKDLIP